MFGSVFFLFFSVFFSSAVIGKDFRKRIRTRLGGGGGLFLREHIQHAAHTPKPNWIYFSGIRNVLDCGEGDGLNRKLGHVSGRIRRDWMDFGLFGIFRLIEPSFGSQWSIHGIALVRG